MTFRQVVAASLPGNRWLDRDVVPGSAVVLGSTPAPVTSRERQSSIAGATAHLSH